MLLIRRVRVAAPAAVLWALCGCGQLNMRPGSESVLDLFAEPTLEDGVRLATDPYDPDKRYRGTVILGQQAFAGDPLYMQLFLANAKDRDAGVRVVSIRALANHGGVAEAPVLIAAMDDADPLVRLEAARGLQRVHSPEAPRVLIRAIELRRGIDPSEPNHDVRAEAAHALGQYPEPRVLQALIAALDDPHLSVNRTALESLRTLTGQDLGLDRRAWLRWISASDQPFAARRIYVYPAFNRPKKWYEYIPFVPPPPNEAASIPAGVSPVMDP